MADFAALFLSHPLRAQPAASPSVGALAPVFFAALVVCMGAATTLSQGNAGASPPEYVSCCGLVHAVHAPGVGVGGGTVTRKGKGWCGPVGAESIWQICNNRP